MYEERKKDMLETLKNLTEWEIVKYTPWETRIGISIYGKLKNKKNNFPIEFRYSDHSTGTRRIFEEWHICRVFVNETIEEINTKLYEHMQYMIEQTKIIKENTKKRQLQEKYRKNYIDNRLQSLRIYWYCKKITKKELQEKIRKLSFVAKCNYDKRWLWEKFYGEKE